MTFSDWVYAGIGLAALLAAVVPRAVMGRPLSMPMVFLAGGALLYALPIAIPVPDPIGERLLAEHVTEACVIISLMGAGLAINRPFGRRTWSTTGRLLAIAMPLTVAGTGIAAWLLLGWPPAAALLIAVVLAPTDPVLASEVQVGEPTDSPHGEDEVRFGLTSEAGLNDALAFPAVYAAIGLATATAAGDGAGWAGHWVLVDVVYKCAVAMAAGLLMGRGLEWLIFRANSPILRLAPHREGFVALAVTFLTYGATELLQGYGFLAVFIVACRIRTAARDHGYHNVLHEFVEQTERLLTAGLLMLLGGFVVSGGMSHLTWEGAAVGLLLLLVIRPASGWVAQLRGTAGPRERWVIAFFGIRGIGSLFYLAYALGQADFGVSAEELWAVVSFTVVASVLLHGAAATPVVSRLDRRRRELAATRKPGELSDTDIAAERL